MQDEFTKRYRALAGRTIGAIQSWLPSLLAACMLLGMAHASATDQIYSFVDQYGVIHLSNVPADPRYQVIGQVTQSNNQSPDSQPSEETEQPPLNEEAPVLPENERYTTITIPPNPPNNQ